MSELIVVISLGCALLAAGAWWEAQRHGAECDRCLKGGEGHER